MRRKYKWYSRKQTLIMILMLFIFVFSGCSYKNDKTDNPATSSDNVNDSEEPEMIAQDNFLTEDNIVAATDIDDNFIGEEAISSAGITTEAIIKIAEEMVTKNVKVTEETIENIDTETTTENSGEMTEENIEDSEIPVENIEADTAEENTLCVGIAKEIFEETNEERAAAGLPELEWSDELAIAADIRAEEIIDCFDHVRPDGTKCYALGDRIHGENIARGPHATGREFVEHWMESPGHRENILCEAYTIMGVGTRYVEMGDTAVQLFGY